MWGGARWLGLGQFLHPKMISYSASHVSSVEIELPQVSIQVVPSDVGITQDGSVALGRPRASGVVGGW
jgi:hypothetical protein